MSELPQGWAACLMGDIATVVGGGTPKADDSANFDDTGHPWITPADLSGFTGMYIRRGRRSLSERGLRSSSAVSLPAGTVLFTSRAPIGYVAIAANEIATNQGFRSFVLEQGIVPEYVFFYMKTMKPVAEQMASGTTFLEISGTNAGKLPIVVPPTNEQRRIVTKLEQVLSRVDACREQLERVPALLKRFRQSVLAAACSGRLTEDWREEHPDIEPATVMLARLNEEQHYTELNDTIGAENLPEIPETWTYSHLQVVGELSRGKSRHRPRNDPRLYDGRYPFIQTGDVANAGEYIVSHKQTYNDLGLAQSRLFPSGTLCITIAANIADTALLTYPACFPDSVVGFIPYAGFVDSFFTLCFVRTVQNDLETYAPATAQKNINLEILSKVALPVPPYQEQQEIVRRVTALFTLADRLEARYAQAKQHVDRLPQSILAKAFRGELVPQDPNDEPAEMMLARIQRLSSPSDKRKSHTARRRDR